MKITLFIAPTPNGFIAKPGNDTSFVSNRDWLLFLKDVKKIKCVIMGRNTYEQGAMSKVFPLKGCMNVVLTREKMKSTDNCIFTNAHPKQILKLIEKRGYKHAALIGGGVANSVFMSANCVDELCLDFMPRIFGKGIRGFAEIDFENRLKLISIRKLSADEIRLRYKVLKSGKR